MTFPEARLAANLLSFAQGGPVISRRALGLVGCGLVAMGALCAFQKPFRVYPSMEAYDDIPLPPDWQEKAEWVQARLMYPQHPEARFARFRYGRLDWREGRHQLDAGLSARRPPFRPGAAPADAD